jgi:hypothetical protein
MSTIPPLSPSIKKKKQTKEERREVRKLRKAARKKEKRKERDRFILIEQKNRRKKRNDEKNVASQRLTSMMDHYLDYSSSQNKKLSAPRVQVPATGNFETARSTDAETMLFHLLSRQAATTHPAYFGSSSKRNMIDANLISPIWYNYDHTKEANLKPSLRHPAAGWPRHWISDESEIVLDSVKDTMNESGSDDDDEDFLEKEKNTESEIETEESSEEEDDDEEEKRKRKNETEIEKEEREERKAEIKAEKRRKRRLEKERKIEERKFKKTKFELNQSLLLTSLRADKTHPVCWNRKRATINNQHPAFGHRFLKSLNRTKCQSTIIHPSTTNRTLMRKELPKPIYEIPKYNQNKDHTIPADIHVELPKGPIECPVCKGQPGRLGRSGCAACWRNPSILPWTFPARTMPGVEQGYSVSNLKFQTLLRLRKRGDERVTRAKNVRQELPSVSGNLLNAGDIEKDRANADLCTHTPFYSRSALSLHRVKNEQDMLRIIIRNLPDDGILVDLKVCPHVTTLAHLNLLYVCNSSDPTCGLCLEGRASPLVLIVPTEEGAYHIDLRQENVTDLQGYYNFSPGSATYLSELKFGNRTLNGSPDTLLLLRVPVLSNIAVRQLLTVFLSVNTSMKIESNSRAVRLLRNKMFEIPSLLPGEDVIQSYMTPLMLRKREVKRMIEEQVRAEEKAREDEKNRIERAEEQRKWKQARRLKNRELLLKKQAAEAAEKRRLENIKKANQKLEEERIAKRKKEAAKQAMMLLRAGKG